MAAFVNQLESTAESVNYVYVATQSCFPGYSKIGMSDCPPRRIKELSGQNLFPYECKGSFALPGVSGKVEVRGAARLRSVEKRRITYPVDSKTTWY